MREISSSIAYEIHSGETLPLKVARSTKLVVRGGAVWVTRSDDTEDYWLQPGHTLRLRRGERLWLSAEGTPRATVAFSCADALRRARAELVCAHRRAPRGADARRLAHRLTLGGRRGVSAATPGGHCRISVNCRDQCPPLRFLHLYCPPRRRSRCAGAATNPTKPVSKRCARSPTRAPPTHPTKSGWSNIRPSSRLAGRRSRASAGCRQRHPARESGPRRPDHVSRPGQVVAYLLLDLRRRKLMVREMVTRIEQAVIDTLAAYNLAGERKAGAPGIYVAPGPQAGLHAGAKIAALGLKIRNGCSYHGVSLNVKMDLRPFLAINPCGYAGLETVDMATLGVVAGWDDVARTLAARLTANLDGSPAAVDQPRGRCAHRLTGSNE